MAHESEDLCRSDASGALELALEYTRSGAETIRRGGGLFAATQFAAEIEAFRRFAETRGLDHLVERIIDPPDKACSYTHGGNLLMAKGDRLIAIDVPVMIAEIKDIQWTA